MKTFATVATLSALVASAFGQALTIQTPASLVVCQPAAIIYSGGTGPYFITALPGGQISATPLEQFPEQQTAGTFTWNPVNLPAGTNITLAVRDGTGTQNFASPVVIQPGTTTACLSNTSSAAGSVSPATTADSSTTAGGETTTTSAAGASSVTTTTTTTRAGATTSPAVTPAGTSSTAAPAATTTKSGASSLTVGTSLVLAVGLYAVGSLFL